MKEKIVKLSEREHILRRPSMYVGSIKKEESQEYIYTDGKFTKQSVLRTPGLLKIINEIIDNSVDEFIKTEGKFSTKIDVILEKEFFSVKDNGRGIPVESTILPDGSEILTPELCWTHARAGSNFNDNSSSIGTNGVGSALTSIFSKSFTGETKDGKSRCILKTKNNNDSIVCEIVSSTKDRGTSVTSYPDFERFEEKEFNEDYAKIIQSRLYFLSACYAKITFTFNKEKINIDPKALIGMFSDKSSTIVNTDKYTIAITISETDELQQFTLMNGLYLKNGGSCVDFLTSELSNRIKDKLSKKYPSLKPADIKNKMFIISVLNDFKDAKYDSQTKEKMTNSYKEVKDYFSLDLEDLANKVSKNKELIDSITDYFRIKEEFKKRQELKNLEKPQKKIKSKKYTPPIGAEEGLLLCEGYSAVSGLVACLGRKGLGYFELRGKVKNVDDDSAIFNNEELTELYKIIKNSITLENLPDGDFYELEIDEGSVIVSENDIIETKGSRLEVKSILDSKKARKISKLSSDEIKRYKSQSNISRKQVVTSGYKRIIIATDADLDGIHISSLLINFFSRSIPEVMEMLYKLNTPVAATMNGKKIKDWCYRVEDISKLEGKEVKYFKGLGSWTKELLDQVIKEDGLEKMLVKLEYNSNRDFEHIKNWFDSDKKDKRKEMILESDFSLISV